MKHDKLAEALATRPAEKLLLALTLAVIAGFVDILGYLTLLNIFTSHMSGNSIAMVACLARHQWNEAIRHAAPIPAFIVGVFLAATLGIFAGQNGLKRRLSIAMGFEAALLVAFAFYMRPVMPLGTNISEWQLCVGSMILAAAMGVQSAALRRVWGTPIHTAFITGMLAQLGENVAELWFAKEKAPKALQVIMLNAGIWVAFVGGAACGGFGEMRFGLAALIAPLGLLAVVIVCDLIWPVHHNPP
jgi:uncharacterized membrane protein YoaK (UPF0700 family)